MRNVLKGRPSPAFIKLSDSNVAVDTANTRVLKEEQYKHRDKEIEFPPETHSYDSIYIWTMLRFWTQTTWYYNAATNALQTEHIVKSDKNKLCIGKKHLRLSLKFVSIVALQRMAAVLDLNKQSFLVVFLTLKLSKCGLILKIHLMANTWRLLWSQTI